MAAVDLEVALEAAAAGLAVVVEEGTPPADLAADSAAARTSVAWSASLAPWSAPASGMPSAPRLVPWARSLAKTSD